MSIEIQNVVFACPGNTEESYERGARPIATFYAGLLGMRIIREDWYLIASDDDPDGLRLGFGDGPIDYLPPRWPDPDYPQQLHLDIAVADLSTADQQAVDLGATRLRDCGNYRVYADPIGHPFCLYDGGSGTNRVIRIVVDCPDPRALASFYSALLGLPVRELDTPERVVITRPGNSPALAFQHAESPAPRWPDPAYPQQVHLDLRATDLTHARAQATSLGAAPLQTTGPHHHVYADPSSHPFCL